MIVLEDTDGGWSAHPDFLGCVCRAGSNELEYARLVARAYRTEHREVVVSPAEFFAELPRLWAERLAASALPYVHEHCSWDAVAERFICQCPSRRAAREPS
jgi:hypothetical protein